MNNITKGELGEQVAAKYLKKQGYEILKKNARFGSIGEVDLIAKEKDEYIFVEVKMRKEDTEFGDPSEAVNKRKQKTIKKMADIYLQGFRKDENLRFDIVEVLYMDLFDEIKITNINHIQDAFW